MECGFGHDSQQMLADGLFVEMRKRLNRLIIWFLNHLADARG
jgi:hypothetical protein